MEMIIQSLGWPIVALILGMYALNLFKTSVQSLIARIDKIEKNVVTFVKEQDGVQTAVKALEQGVEELEQGVGTIGSAIQDLRYGTYLKNMKTFSQAVDWVEKDLVSHNKLDIIISALGMAYSWKGFVINIPKWLQTYPDCKITARFLLVNPDYLDALPMLKVPTDWAKESRTRIKDIEDLLESISDEQSARDRLCLEVRYYEGLPQYHGILLNNEQLFLGRTAWEFDSKSQKEPTLTAGTNSYRYYNSTTKQGGDIGAERIQLFFNWHRYIWEYSSKSVIKFEHGRCENRWVGGFKTVPSPCIEPVGTIAPPNV